MNKAITQFQLGSLLVTMFSVLAVALPLFIDVHQPLTLAVLEILAIAVSATVLAMAIKAGVIRLPDGFTNMAASVFLLLAVLSCFFSVYQPTSWRALFWMLLIGLVAVAATNLTHLVSGFSLNLFWAIVISALLQSLIGLHQQFFSGFYQQFFNEFYTDFLMANARGGSIRSIGTFQNANYYAAFLNIGLALSVAQAISTRDELWKRGIYALISLQLFLGVFLSGSKMALAIAALTIALLLVRRKLLLAIPVVAVVIGLVVVPNPLKDSVMRGISGDATFGMRPALWATAAEMTIERPLWGTGPNNYRFLSHLHQPATEHEVARYGRVPTIAHNSTLQVFAEAGIFAGVAAVVLFCRLLWFAFFIYVGRWREKEYTALQVAAAVAIFGVVLHSLLDNTLNHPALLFIFALLTPFIIGGRIIIHEGPMASVKPGKLRLALATGLAIILISISALYAIDHGMYEQRMKTADDGIETGLRLLSFARSSDDPRRTQAVNRLFEVAKTMQQYGDLYDGRLTFHRKLGLLNKVFFEQSGEMQFFNNAINHFRAADAALHNASREDVYNELEVYLSLVRRGYFRSPEIVERLDELRQEIVLRWPRRAYFHVVAASISMELDDVHQARQHIEEAIALEPRYLKAYIIGDRLGILTGNQVYRKEQQAAFAAALEELAEMDLPGRSDAYTWLLISPSQRYPDQEWLEIYADELDFLSKRVQ